MKKVTCDRCNDNVRFTNGGEVILRPAREPLDIFSYDLCQPCLAGLRDYLKAPRSPGPTYNITVNNSAAS